MSGLEDDEKVEILSEYGLEESGLDNRRRNVRP
jgi:hypothetical protein